MERQLSPGWPQLSPLATLSFLDISSLKTNDLFV